MRKSFSIALCFVMLFSSVFQTNIVFAATASVAPTVDEVTITNNYAKSDTIYVTGLTGGDKVKVYNAATGGKIIGTATAGGQSTFTTINIAQIGINGGSAYITVTSKGMDESVRTEVPYDAEPISDSPIASNITITNNSNKADTINVAGINPGDVIKLYRAASGGIVLTSATARSNSTDATMSISQLGVAGGTVYITTSTKGMHESARVAATFSDESSSTQLSANNITVTNNSGKADTIYAYGLGPGDVMKVYTAATGGKLLGTATVSSSRTEATVTVSQLGVNAGSVYVSVTTSGLLESLRTEADFSAEGQADLIQASNVTITNNITGTADTIRVTGLSAADVVKVYTASTGGKLLGTATVGSSSSEATISVSQLGTAAGSVYISVTSTGTLESSRVKIDYTEEYKSSDVGTSDVVVTNNAGKADTVVVSGVSEGDVIKVYRYSTGGTTLGTATVATSATEGTVSISQLGTASGTVYVTVTSTGQLESDRILASYSAEGTSSTLDTSNIIVSNNATGKSDTVYVSNLTAADIINVYDAATGGNLLGTGTVGASSTDVTISITQLGTSAGSVYISKTSTGKSATTRVQVDYSAESKSSTLDAGNIIVTNNAGKADTVQVEGLSDNEVVQVYDAASGGNLLGTATVAQYGTEATVTISQLGTIAGNIYVSLTDTNKLESSRVTKAYSAESSSTVVTAANVTVNNNSAVADTVIIKGLTAGDIANVYDSSVGGNLLGTGTVAASSSTVTVSIAQLGVNAGSVYVSVTSVGKLASQRLNIPYAAESSTDAIVATNISITNNIASADTVKVTGLTSGDVINVYSLISDGDLLGTATVAASSTTVTISIAQLGTSSGSVYVTRTSLKKAESTRVKADYLAEPASSAPSASNIIITNNAGIADTIQVTGISANDVVNVYDAAANGNLLGTATVGAYGSDATVTINQLGSTAGNVYISVTSTNKSESSRTQVGFSAEAKSTAPLVTNVSIINNSGIASTITVSGLAGNDVVNIYDATSGGNLLGTATVGTNESEATISVTQLTSAAGSVYVSVISTGKLESDRTTAGYTSKLVSSAPNVNSVTVVNNAGIQDTIKVTGLQSSDLVKVYDSATGGNLLTSATVASGSLSATLTVSQLGVDAGNIYISVKSTGKTESSRTTVAFNAEAQSDAPVVGDITTVNNSGSSDTITVTGLTTDDVVTVYSAATNGTQLGTATVTSGNSQGVVSISQLGTTAGSVYVSVTRSGKTESNRIQVVYTAESTAPIQGNITITNNAVLADTITVNGLTANDIVKVYDAASNGQLLGTATVTSNSTSATVTISQLTSAAGSVYISVTNFGKSESSKTKADYLAEQSSNGIYVGNVNIANNKYSSGISDVITVSNLTSNNVIRVYDAASGGNLIGVATVSSGGTTVTITITELGTGAGSVYMTLTVPGKNESSRTKVDYVAEN